jgi:hypothetical protein
MQMKKILSITQFIYDRSRLKAIIIFSIAFVITLALMMYKPFGVEAINYISPGAKILDGQFNYSAMAAHETLNRLGPLGRAAYFKLLMVDFFYILAYMGFYIVALAALAKYFFPRVRVFRFLWILPLSCGFLDFVENIFTLAQLNVFPNERLSVYGISNVVTMLKMIVGFPCEIAVLIGSAVFIISFLVKKFRSEIKSSSAHLSL